MNGPSARLLRCVAILAFLAATSPVSAGVSATWPGAAPCNASLQACIDGTPGEAVITITAALPIDENIAFTNRNLTLRPSPGSKPTFAAGRSVSANFTSPAAGSGVALEGIALVDGSFLVNCNGTGSASARIEGVSVTGTVGASASITAEATSGCALNVAISNNDVRGGPSSLNSGMITLRAIGGTLSAYAAYNRLVRTDGGSSGGGILVDVASIPGAPAGGFMRMFGNEIRGGFNRGALFFSEGLAGAAASTFGAVVVNNVIVCPGSGNGIAFTAGSGRIATEVVNNTVSGCTRGVTALRWDSGSETSRISGSVWNNILAATTQGMTFTTTLTPDLANDYNLINAPSMANVSLGSNTFSFPARFVSPDFPRLLPDSPAIDAADGPALGAVLVDNGLPATDADGLRRVKGARADRGAYEAGDRSFTHTSSVSNSQNNITRIDDPATNDNSAARVLPTRVFQGGATSLIPFGLYYEGGSRWTIFNENVTSFMQPGLQWANWVPGNGAGAFIHLGTAANTTGASTRIEDPTSNGQPGRIVLASHNWSATPTYNLHNIGVFYSGSGSSGRWNIANIDQVALPPTSAFNVYSQPPSPNAFRIGATTGAQIVPLDHRLLNGIACARFHVTRVVPAASSSGTDGFDLGYATSIERWQIYSSTPFVAGTSFNVVVDPAQVFACTDRIFANGFD